MSTTTAVVPASVQLAAKRAFVRTTAQAYASTIPAGGVSAAALIALVHSPDPVVLACMAIAAVASPPLAGFASWLSILSKGLPDAYTAVVTVAPATIVPAAPVATAGATLVPDPAPASVAAPVTWSSGTPSVAVDSTPVEPAPGLAPPVA